MGGAMKPTNPYLEAVPDDSNERGRQFAKLIRDARANAGLTQDEVVAQSGVSKSTLIRWEGGRAERPDPDQVRALCRTLGIDPREAAIALGYLDRENVAEANRERPLSPTLREVIEILEDPRVPTERKEEWIRYLQYLKSQSLGNSGGQRRAG